MQEPRAVTPTEVSNPKPRKKKSPTQAASGSGAQMKGETKGGKTTTSLQSHGTQKGCKRSLKNNASSPNQHTDQSTPDSLADASGSSNEYRTLRRKYLLLEEESFSFGTKLSGAEQEVKALEDEKFALLDQLVVLEGLIDASELQSQGDL